MRSLAIAIAIVRLCQPDNRRAVFLRNLRSLFALFVSLSLSPSFPSTRIEQRVPSATGKNYGNPRERKDVRVQRRSPVQGTSRAATKPDVIIATLKRAALLAPPR